VKRILITFAVAFWAIRLGHYLQDIAILHTGTFGGYVAEIYSDAVIMLAGIVWWEFAQRHREESK